MKRLFLLPALLLLCACQAPSPAPSSMPEPSPTAQTVDFHTFAAQVNGDRKAAIQTEEVLDLSAWTVDFPTDVFTEEELALLTTPHAPSHALTQEEMAQDIETAFLLLKSTYGAYDYFGGDEVFLPIRDAVLEEAAQLRYPISTMVEQILFDHLSPVLKDGHFSVGSHSMITPHVQTMYYVPGLYLDAPDGSNDPWLRPTIAEDGRIAYGFVALANSPEGLPATATVAGEEVSLTWREARTAGRENYAFSETDWSGIPVLQSKYMYKNDYSPEWNTQLERFSTCGAEYADLPLFVFDVRSNPGGSDIYMMNWFEGFAGQPAQPKRTFTKKVSQLGVHQISYPAEKLGSWQSYSDPGAWTENDSLIFLLQDGWTASSGETVVEFLHSTDNVVSVGSPSGGCALVPNNLYFYLPHSGIKFYFGTGLSFCESLENRDGIGYLPDLWVNPAQAQEAILRLVDYYDLRNSDTE